MFLAPRALVSRLLDVFVVQELVLGIGGAAERACLGDTHIHGRFRGCLGPLHFGGQVPLHDEGTNMEGGGSAYGGLKNR